MTHGAQMVKAMFLARWPFHCHARPWENTRLRKGRVKRSATNNLEESEQCPHWFSTAKPWLPKPKLNYCSEWKA
jgi:hypothetical protein